MIQDWMYAFLVFVTNSSFFNPVWGGPMEYFTFEIDGEKVGYYEQRDQRGVFYSNAWIEMGGERFNNPFWVKHQDGKVTAYKLGDGDYLELPAGDNIFPTSALYLLAINMAGQNEVAYQVFHEGQGKVTGTATLKRNGDRIEEEVEGQVGRYLILKEGKVIEYGWGGTAKSIRVEDEQEARKGTVFEKQP